MPFDNFCHMLNLSIVPTDVPPNFNTFLTILDLYIYFKDYIITYLKLIINDMTTINKEEIQKFSDLAEECDVNGKFKPLHMFNPIRIEYITENIKKHFNIKTNNNFLKN